MNTLLTIEEISRLIPHRYPFLLVDRIVELNANENAVGIKNVSMNEWFFAGHFPDRPIMPGVLIVEALAQTAAVLFMKSKEAEIGTTFNSQDSVVYFMSIENAKFRKPVVPGDQLTLKVFKEKERNKSIWRMRGEAWVGENLTDEATFMAMFSEKKS